MMTSPTPLALQATPGLPENTNNKHDDRCYDNHIDSSSDGGSKSAVHCCLVSIAAETAHDAIDAMMQFATLRLRTWWEFTPLVQL